MSLGIAFKGPEGIVLAADSRVTLSGPRPGSNLLVQSHYDNATKLLKVKDHDNVGAVTYGLGALGGRQPRTAHPYLTGSMLLLGVVIFSGLMMLTVVLTAKRLAARLTGRGR